MGSEESPSKMNVEIEHEEAPTPAVEEASPGSVEISSGMTSAAMASKVLFDSWEEFMAWRETHRVLPRYHKLATDENALKYSMWTLQFAVLCSAINTKMLNPNYPLMVSGVHPEAFPDTEPFDFNSATYFIPMMSLLGVAISSTIVGKLSDKVGRKKPLLIMAAVSGVGSIVKYLARDTFWGFCAANLAFGFFLGNLPVAMAYVGDVFESKKEKQERLGTLVGNFVMGNAGGGMIAILMQDSGLFAPLWVGAGLMFVSAILIVFYFIESGDVRLVPIGKDALVDDEEDEARPTEINQKAMWNVVGGALADNFGSTALFPLCLSPLALEQYTLDFIRNMEDPIMSYTGYQWLSVCVALLVIPSTFVTPYLFAKIGCSGTCVLGNVCTALLTIALLLIGNGPATTAAFAGFVTVLYAGFPTTVWSQLTTGPMLDVIAPEDKLGFVQGLNNSCMNLGMAVAPWLFGVLADATSTNTSIWTGIGISFGAAAINAPLMWRPEMGPAQKKAPPEKRVLPGEDEELAEKALHGEAVSAEQLFELNRKRALQRKPAIVASVKTYEEDKDSLDELLGYAKQDFQFRKEMQNRFLAELADPDSDKDVGELCELLNATTAADPDVVKEHNDQLGVWISDYLQENGYQPHMSTTSIKQMILMAFPSITQEKEYTPDNISEIIVRRQQVSSMYLETYEKKKYGFFNIVGNGARPQFYS